MLHRIPKNLHLFLFCGTTLVCVGYFCLYARDGQAIAAIIPINDRKETDKDISTPAIALKKPRLDDPSTLADKLKCRDFSLEMQRIQYGSYWLLQNLVIGSVSRNIGCADSITYATNGDYTFFWALGTLIQRWLAPISFAVYAPGYDINGTLESIQHVRNCLKESDLIRKFITFHVFFPAEHMPTVLPFDEDEVFDWPYNCTRVPYAKDQTQKLYRKEHGMTYPINVGRNIARRAANTYFILTCDIELYPSPGLVDKFLQMINRNTSLAIDADEERQNPRVFVLNVFELQANALLPNDKKQLKRMFDKNQALRFHVRRCVHCHEVEYWQKWLNLTTVEEMGIIGVVKRLQRHSIWEPFYISDNKEPTFDERVTWEGQKNKRIQGYAMCLLDYDYYVLDDGFLVHSPGVKKATRNRDPRMRYVTKMNKYIRRVIVKEYRKLYGNNTRCAV